MKHEGNDSTTIEEEEVAVVIVVVVLVTSFAGAGYSQVSDDKDTGIKIVGRVVVVIAYRGSARTGNST